MRESRCLVEVFVWLLSGTKRRAAARKPHPVTPQNEFCHKLAEYKKSGNRLQPFSTPPLIIRAGPVEAPVRTLAAKLMFLQKPSLH